ncbi:response regulator [Terasakiella pusilla]|uniref:response regulator n=1 Tax=Terasakiella pusilla TaxID=64973 RepID=UPI00048D0592|nr:response regulator [Terasakiella pusilla]
MKSILIVDDDPMVLESTQTYLETHGYQTHVARDGEEALKAARDHPIDLAIIDIYMPKKGGFETIASMQGRFPMIAMTGVISHRFDPLSFAQSMGAFATLSKPFYLHELLKTVKEILD